jgi:hypothetical protein
MPKQTITASRLEDHVTNVGRLVAQFLGLCRASSWFTTGPLKTIDTDTHQIFLRLRLF